MEKRSVIIKIQPTKEQIRSEHAAKFDAFIADWQQSLMAQKLRTGLAVHMVLTEDFHIMIKNPATPNTHVALVYSDEEWIQLFVKRGILEMPLKRPVCNLLMLSPDQSLINPIVNEIIYFLE